MQFEWEETKNQSNIRKHDVNFLEAETAFSDDNAKVYDDPDHSDEENRFILLGFSTNLRLLVVVHCLRDEGDTIRLISARKATRRERATYSGELG